MIPPVWTLGKEFLTSTTFERKGDLFRIVGKLKLSLNILFLNYAEMSTWNRMLSFYMEKFVIIT